MQHNTKKGNCELYILISLSWDKKISCFGVDFVFKKKCFAYALCGSILSSFIQIKLPFFRFHFMEFCTMPSQPTLVTIIS